MKKPKTIEPAAPIPAVRESGKEVAEKRRGQLMEERKRRGMRATLMSQSSTGQTLG